MTLKFSISAILACALSPCFAIAAGPYVVDDADIVDAHQFQSESWLSHTSKGENIAVINGAFRLADHTEFTLEEDHDAGGGNHSDTLSPQIKYLWHKTDSDAIASSLVIGGDYLTDKDRVSGFYAYVPISYKVNPALDLNVDLGAQYEQQGDRHIATWGVGTEYHLTKSTSFIGEVFGDNTTTPGIQFGPHFEIGDQFQFDFVYGHNVFGESENVITAGLTVEL